MSKLKSLVHCINFGQQYDCISQIPKNKIGVVSNIEKYIISGKINLYYKHILETTLSLFKSKKIELILINCNTTNNDLKNDLIEFGVPENNIYMDVSNFKTLDSVIATKRLFGLNKITLIS
ncbi:hypothetical protein [Seonamhaeicola marinus]|uniref:Uncharacterized protein n=1 Tax=Seonamhaeicola marinus TaxID=1912246 RepID=A0A5D0IS56_9FLAO|nr:hypothetical protein [Seonamhaeicola marinus]TYA86805.1 hypothetical protein FUA24_04570 [Seonamhaeicola marinus]